MFEDLAYNARRHSNKLVFSLFPCGFAEKCFDGKPFSCESHAPTVEGKNVKPQSNKGAYKLTQESCGAARSQMMCLADNQGEVMFIVPDLLVVSPLNCRWFHSWRRAQSNDSCFAPSAR